MVRGRKPFTTPKHKSFKTLGPLRPRVNSSRSNLGWVHNASTKHFSTTATRFFEIDMAFTTVSKKWRHKPNTLTPRR